MLINSLLIKINCMDIKESFNNYFRPKELDEVVGQKHLLSKKSIFYQILKKKENINMIFYGPSGTGKTTLAKIIAKNIGIKIYEFNCTITKISDLKKKIVKSTEKVLVYLDEIQYFSKKQQQILLNFIEDEKVMLIASTVENPFFYIYSPILSRSMIFEFKPISKNDIKNRLEKIVEVLKIKIDNESLNFISAISNGDMRKAINYIEFIYKGSDNKEIITFKKCNEVIDKANINFNRTGDIHYDFISALHKSIRGSDVDASLFYLAKLLDGGDLISACRRLLCVANEDIGLANPQVISIAKNAVDTALMLGLPEGRLPLSNLTILLASSPKSNSALSIDEALKDVRLGKGINIPRIVRNIHCVGKDDEKNKNQNYKYPHNYPNHYVFQQYLPSDIKNSKYYKPGDNKIESSYNEYLNKIKNKKN